jgi:hypothetical protein
MSATGQPGTTYPSGFHIAYQHCGRCGQPDITRSKLTDDGMRLLVGTPCCVALPCNGLVANTPWVGQRTGRRVWACCLGEAERHLDEPAMLILDPSEAVEVSSG